MLEKYYRDVYTINTIDETEKNKYKWVVPVNYGRKSSGSAGSNIPTEVLFDVEEKKV